MNDFDLCLYSALSFFLQVFPPPALEVVCSPQSPHIGSIAFLSETGMLRDRLLCSSMIFLPCGTPLTPAHSCVLSELPSESRIYALCNVH